MCVRVDVDAFLEDKRCVWGFSPIKSVKYVKPERLQLRPPAHLGLAEKGAEPALSRCV